MYSNGAPHTQKRSRVEEIRPVDPQKVLGTARDGLRPLQKALAAEEGVTTESAETLPKKLHFFGEETYYLLTTEAIKRLCRQLSLVLSARQIRRSKLSSRMIHRQNVYLVSRDDIHDPIAFEDNLP